MSSLQLDRPRRAPLWALAAALTAVAALPATADDRGQPTRKPGLRPSGGGIRVPALTQLEGSLDWGDLGPIWEKELKAESPGTLQFRWKTSEKGVAKAQWEVLDKANAVLETGLLATVPPAGQYAPFYVPFADVSLALEPRVRVVPLDANGGKLAASNEVRVTKAGPSSSTTFTDKGRNLPIKPMLEAVRAEFGVPAVGGATVTKDGIEVLDVAGIRKNGNATAVETEDRWHLGSDTKAMTATILAVLAQKGTVPWGITVAQAFPEWAQTMNASLKDATFERLMAHRSGILDVTAAESAALSDGSRTVPERRREFARLITLRKHGAKDVLFDAPGFVFSYQNANFILAGAMLERCTGKSWEDLIETELFRPLGMTTAGFGAPGSANDVKQPYGHSDASGPRVASKGDNTAALGPAGTVHASLRDWARFIRLHIDGSEGSIALSPSTLTRLHTQFATNGVYPQRYGWGWIVLDATRGVGLGHDGSNTLWYCSCQVLPKQGVAFLAVSNIGGGTGGKGDKACWKIIRELSDRHFEK